MASKTTIEERRARARDFLWIVQAGLLAQAAKVRRSDPGRDDTIVVEYSGSGVFMHMDEAVRAAGLIPDDMTVKEAAEAFCSRYAKLERSSRDVPHWFARYGYEQHDYTVVSKADQFLWTVQTAALADAENQASYDAKVRKSERFGPETVVETMAEAVRVAPLIPKDTDATEAASEFLAFYAPGMKERRTPPKWCRG